LDATSFIAGSVVVDYAGLNNAVVHGGVTAGGASSPVLDDTDAPTFDGSTGYIELPVGSPVALSGTWSVEFWANVLSNTPGGSTSWGAVGSRGMGDLTFDAQIYGPISTTKIHGDIGTGLGWITNSADATVPWDPNTWYHIVYVVTGTTWEVFVDGASAASGSFSSATPVLWDAVRHFRIGQVGASQSDGFWPGAVSQVAIYDHALTSDRVLAHYLAGVALTPDVIDVPMDTPAPTLLNGYLMPSQTVVVTSPDPTLVLGGGVSELDPVVVGLTAAVEDPALMGAIQLPPAALPSLIAVATRAVQAGVATLRPSALGILIAYQTPADFIPVASPVGSAARAWWKTSVNPPLLVSSKPVGASVEIVDDRARAYWDDSFHPPKLISGDPPS